MIKLIKSFNWAINGLKTVWFEERNFRLECFIALIVLAVALIFGFSFTELTAIIFAIILVLSAEAVNTALEDLCNKVEPEVDPLIGKIKDIIAAFVLIVSLGTAIIGLVVFGHHFLNYF